MTSLSTIPDRHLAPATHPTAAPDAGTQPLISVANLHVRFSGHRTVHAVRGVSFDIHPGEAVAIVGESGSGKSVTSRSIVGLAGQNSTVTADAFTVMGNDALTLSERLWRKVRGRRIGLVFQDALTSLDPLRTVEHEIAETLREHRIVARKAIPERVHEVLRQVGIPDPQVRARQYPHQLSGGLRQRALIASALAGAPELIIADEPTTALDVTVQAQILDLLEERRSAGTALLLVSHDLAVVSRIADRVLVMNDGVVVEEGPTERVLTDPADPYTQRLLAAIPSATTRGQRLSQPTGGVGQTESVHTEPTPVPGTDSGNHTAAPILEAQDVGKTFTLPNGVQRTVVHDVNFELNPGQILGIVGESGSGKSTLARVLLGLLPADEGNVLVHGQSWNSARRSTNKTGDQATNLSRSIQFISQDPLGSFDPRYDVTDIISEPLRGQLPKQELRQRVHELLTLVGLDESFAAAMPRRLSGGQRQRVSIARALALEPEVLICDEPVSALDVSIQAQVLDLLADLNQRTGTALIFISHDLGVVHHLVDQVLVMRHGRVVESGDVDDVFTRPLHPYTQQLIAAIPRLPDTTPQRQAVPA